MSHAKTRFQKVIWLSPLRPAPFSSEGRHVGGPFPFKFAERERTEMRECEPDECQQARKPTKKKNNTRENPIFIKSRCLYLFWTKLALWIWKFPPLPVDSRQTASFTQKWSDWGNNSQKQKQHATKSTCGFKQENCCAAQSIIHKDSWQYMLKSWSHYYLIGEASWRSPTEQNFLTN